jgi:NADH-quinone oxidoreductase subunit L
MYHAIVFLPLVGFLIAGFFGRVIGARASEVVTTALLFLSAVLSWIAFVNVGFGTGATRVQVANWMTSGDLVVDWAFRIDTLTVVMLVVVNTVSALVHLYSIGYMAEDPHRPRFFAYLSLFTFAMLMLVTADNLVQMFFGWEGVGLASYLLIGFWYEKESARAAAIKAVRGQPGRRFRLRPRHLSRLRAFRHGRLRRHLSRAPPSWRTRNSAFSAASGRR